MSDPSLFDLAARTHARADDLPTSHAAASPSWWRSVMLRRLLIEFDAGDLTAEEAADRAGFTAAQGAWKRVSDLAGKGLIEDTDTTRPGRSGRPQIVRTITAEGRKAIRS